MQNGIQPGLITTGAVVKDSPETNPIDLIYQTNATPGEIDPGVPKLYTPINTTAAVDAYPIIDTGANVAAVDVPQKNNTVIVLAAAGLGALLLFSNDGKKAVNGIAGIGKKGKTSVLPLLLVGGAAAAWYFTKDKSSNDPDAAGLVVVPGTAKLTDTMRDNVFERAKSWVNPVGTNEWYPEIYRDVLLLVLPKYSTVWNKMGNDETTVVYQLVIDHPSGLTQTENPALYAQLQAVKNKYNLKFY